MPTPLVAIATGAWVGWTLAVPPGPVNAIIARESAHHGTRAGVKVGLAAPIVDTLIMVLLVFGVAKHLDLSPIERWSALFGFGLLSWFAIGAGRASDKPAKGEGTISFWGMFILSGTSPYQWAWWLSGGTLLLDATGAWGVVGFLAAIFSWVFVFSWAMHRGAEQWSWFKPLVTVLSADMLVVCALLFGALGFGLVHL